MDLGVVIVLILALWSITKIIEKLTDKVLKQQERQTQLLEEIIAKLDGNERR